MSRPRAVAACTAKGRRRQNEDALATLRLPDGRDLVVVSDGMGGHKAGDVASRVTVRTFVTALRRASSGPAEGLLDAAFRAAADAVAKAAGVAGREGMGATLVAALVEDEQVSLVYAGDSPAVLVQRESVVRLTKEHTLVGEAVRQGMMTEVEALNHPLRRAVLRALGHDDVAPDFAHVGREQWARGGAVLLLGSDGLFGSVGDDEILEEIWRDRDLDAALGRLVLRAIRNGSDDNVTAVAVALGESHLARPSRRAIGLLVLAAAVLAGLALLAWQLATSRAESRGPAPADTRVVPRSKGAPR